MNDDIQLGSTAAERILSVLSAKPKWYHYIPHADFGITRAAVPLIKEYSDFLKVGKDIAKYNATAPKDDRLIPDNNDQYFHQRAMYQAAQGGIMPALMAALAGELREYTDIPKYRKKGLSEEEIQKERQKDLKNNYKAIIMALEDSRPVDEVIKPNPTMVSYMRKKENGEI